MKKLKNRLICLYLKHMKGIKTGEGLIRFALAGKGREALFIQGSREWGLEKLVDRARLMIHAFAAERVGPGDVVALHMRNSLEYLEIRTACFLGGQIFCALIDDFSVSDIVVKLRETKARILYHDDRLSATDLDAIRRACPSLILRHGGSEHPHDGATLSLSRKKIGPDDLSAVGFTSGTTGLSKSVLWTQRVWAESFYHFLQNSGPSVDNPVFLLAMPFSTVGSLNILPVMMMGAKAYILEAFDEEAVAGLIRDKGITHLVLAPSFLYRLYALFRERQWEAPPALRSITVGSAVLSPAQWRRIDRFFGGPVNQSYGMAEVLAPLAGRSLDREARDARSVGRPIPQVRVKLRDRDGEGRGLISLRSSTRGLSYLSGDSTPFSKGDWFHTEDWGSFSDTGELTILGRARDRWCWEDRVLFRRELEELFHRIDDVCDVTVYLEGKILSAEVVLHRGSRLRPEDLLSMIAVDIPSPLVPGNIGLTDRLELSSSGKKLFPVPVMTATS